MLRRLTFAAAALHKDTPNYWDLVASFGFLKSSESKLPSVEKLKVVLENVNYLEEDAFNTDSQLMKELMQHEGFQGRSLGIILLSTNGKCKLCEGDLLVRSDRPSFPVVYTNDYGTVHGTHFRKYCQNNWKGCSFAQHYGYHTIGNETEAVYDEYYLKLPYFVSSQMTVFQTNLLCQLTAELLLGQISYQQSADIYNLMHGCESVKKQYAPTRQHGISEGDPIQR